MSINFWWVRHAPTHAKTFIGHTDIPADLSDIAALTRLDQFLPNAAEIMSSDLIRTVKTADAIANSRVRKPNMAALREMDFGDWENRNFSDIAAEFPTLSRDFWESPGHHAPPNGESWDRFSDRIHRAIFGILKDDPANDMIIVAHFGTILAALQLASNMPAASIFAFKIDNLSISRMTFHRKSQSWTINSVNQTV